MADNRQSDMSIDLGDEHVDLIRIEAVESLSTQFTILVDVASPLEIDLQPHLGKPCTLKVFEDNELLRHFHGLVVSAEDQGDPGVGHRYRLTLKPWTYFLSQNRTMAIFQSLSANDIIKKILQKNGISAFRSEVRTNGKTSRVYCVQYRESDFAFISRLMEEEGIYYYFEHSPSGHTMVMCDAPAAHKDGKPPVLTFNPHARAVFAANSEKRSSKGKAFLQSWTERVATQGEAKVKLHDFSHVSPDTPLKGDKQAERMHPLDDREVFDYPGLVNVETLGRGEQEALAKQRSQNILEGFRAQRRMFSGSSQALGLSTGTKFAVKEHPTGRMNASYLVVSTYHSIVAERYRSGTADTASEINVRFEAMPAATPYRPPHATPRPVVLGLETAIVTGPAGEKIYTEEYGRVKVRFHWDREGNSPENSTCWIRVSQTGGLGNIVLPRVGHEVLVDFLGGDPDRPVVVGRVFNKSHMPIYPLPDNKTVALWRTLTYGPSGTYPETTGLDTGSPGVNELRLEDKGGKEEIFLHAERDMKTRIRFDESHHIGHDQDVMIGRSRNEKVVKDETIEIGKSRTEKVGTDEKLTVGLSQKLKVGTTRDTKIGTGDTIDVGTAYKLTANTAIEIVVGGSSIKMDPMSITIKAPMIKIEADMMVGVKGGVMAKLEGGAMTIVKGAITMIN